ncbi:MAG: alpha/beta fold hydrolase [Betaproteobacteria bacterium]|nr:alpha/beta fold hydrolase [Betaproteobacteria bacterium]MBI2961643.1 alpha/beta fold hydrolase [Betaproteobacteria bacterium]
MAVSVSAIVPNAARSLLKRGATLAATIGSAGYVAALAWLYWRQERRLFHPEPLPADHRFALPGVDEIWIDVDGARLSALHLKLPRPEGFMFFLHGNRGNLATWFTDLEFFREANYDLFMIDYRGYGHSTGRIESEAQLRADVRAAWNCVAPQYAQRRKVIYGRSLGTALAAGLASEVQPDLTILVSPYSSMEDLMRERYPLVPTALLRYPLATCQDVGRIRTPVFLIHGEHDDLIPFSHSERILSYAAQARLVCIPGAAHSDIHEFGAYNDAVMRVLKSL